MSKIIPGLNAILCVFFPAIVPDPASGRTAGVYAASRW